MLQRLEKWLLRPIPGGKAFLILLGVSALFIAPILFAGVDYIDDTSRKLEGAYQWGSLGRVVTEGLMHVLTFNFGAMTDPGNLMQILCIPVLALTGFLIAKLFGDNGRITWMSLVVGVQIIPNQLLLANISFRFDSLSMVLGNLVAVFAAYLLLASKMRTYLLLAISTLLIFTAASLYQSTILMFGMVVIVALVLQYAREPQKKLYPTFIKAVGVFGAGMLLYGVMLKLFQFSNLVGSRQDLVPLNATGIKMALDNLKSGLKVVIDFVGNGEAFLLAVLIAGVIGVGLALVIYSLAKKRRLIDTAIVGFSPIFVTLLIMGPFVLLQGFELTTQVRVLTSVIGVMLLSGVIIFALYKTGQRWALWLLAIPLLMNMYSIGFAYTYGATLKAQRVTDHSVYESIVATIQSRPELQTSTLFIGGAPASPWTVLTQLDKRPALKRMDVAGDNSRWYIWNRLRDERISGKAELYSGRHSSQAAAEAICKGPANTVPFLENELYTIHKAWDSVYVVWLKDRLGGGDLCSEMIKT